MNTDIYVFPCVFEQGEWQESTKRKKGKTQPPTTKGEGMANHSDTREKSRDRDDFSARDSGPPRDRDRRGRQPPRLARKLLIDFIHMRLF